MVADVGTGVFTSVDLLLGEARWYRDGQQTLWFDEERGEGPGNVGDCGSTCFDVNGFIARRSIWFGQLIEHLIDEIVVQDFGGIVQLSSERNHMRASQLGDTASSEGVLSCCVHLFNFGVAWIVCSY